MAIEVAVIGIDGSGKGSNIAQSAAHIGKDYPVLIMEWKSIAYVTDERFSYISRLQTSRVTSLLEFIRSIFNRIKIGWHRFRQASLISDHNPVFCFEDRDLVLDPSILIVSYIPVLSKVPISTRVHVMEKLTMGRLSDLYIYLDVTPETAFKRVCRRHRQQNKRLSAHENLPDLRRLRDQYEAGLAFLEGSNIPVFRVNTEGRSIQECSAEIVDFLMRMYLGDEKLKAINAGP